MRCNSHLLKDGLKTPYYINAKLIDNVDKNDYDLLNTNRLSTYKYDNLNSPPSDSIVLDIVLSISKSQLRKQRPSNVKPIQGHLGQI